ncbi:glyceraldehyde 3-phosphate dehydrogenase NAD-binding domain-containing protein [Mycobacterium shigaense]|uniref:glyceraldehyde 3-phosphate dehydrogenase NAD-binding domain-containing protein n=1 Tax=Mycobacterium shigaense TaxID=722731 RepID=UPI000BBA460E|nr:hypothetical protein B2J96_16965 [Mycobacterium shigaense]
MTVRLGIGDFGRIGHNFHRAAQAQQEHGPGSPAADIEAVAVNSITDNAPLAHLRQFDSNRGRLPHEVHHLGLVVDGHSDRLINPGARVGTCPHHR